MSDRKRDTEHVGDTFGAILERLDRQAQDPEVQARMRAREAEVEAEQKRRAEWEAEKKQRQQWRLLVQRGIPVKDLDAIVANSLTPTAALDKAREFLADTGARMLVLAGPRGCGKTTAAAWVIAQRCPDRYRQFRDAYETGEAQEAPLNRDPYRSVYWPGDRHPRFVDVSELQRISRYRDEDMRPLEQCSMLALDDLGMEYADEKGSFLATLDGLINRRYRDSLRTVITTNLTAKHFRLRYGERIADRIRECGAYIELAGASLRGGDKS